MSSAVLLATMAIPAEEKVDVFDMGAQVSKLQRMSSFLSFNNVPVTPKRELLIEELVRYLLRLDGFEIYTSCRALKTILPWCCQSYVISSH